MNPVFTFLGDINTIILNSSHQIYFQEEEQELIELRYRYYEKFLSDIYHSCTHPMKIILFHIPKEHVYFFVQKLAELSRKNGHFLSGISCEVIVFDAQALQYISIQHNDFIKQYEYILEKVSEADKFIEVYNTLLPLESYGEDNKDRRMIQDLDSSFKKHTQIIGKQPRLKTYFPSEIEAGQEGMTLREYYEFCISCAQGDWRKIQEAHGDLVSLFQNYDIISMKGSCVDITFDIYGMGSRSSVIETNYPGSEVFSCPTIDGVDGWIEYHNPVLYHYTGDILTGLRVEITGNILQDIHIFGVIGKDAIESQKVIKKIQKHFNEKQGNKRVGEIAFGTNFFVPVGVKQILIGEKAFGFHFAFGKALPFPGTDNGNQDTTMHWDLIRDMRDDTVVTFSKSNGESITVMKNGTFTQEACPRMYDYYETLKSFG